MGMGEPEPVTGMTHGMGTGPAQPEYMISGGLGSGPNLNAAYATGHGVGEGARSAQGHTYSTKRAYHFSVGYGEMADGATKLCLSTASRAQ